MITVRNVSMYYGNFLAVENLNFEVNQGDIVAFLGPNGAGKTTTMRVITGFMAPSQGEVLIDGMDVYEEPVAVKSMIGYLPENPPLYPDLTVAEFLSFVAELKNVPASDIPKRVNEVLEMTGLTERKNTLIAFLSKGLKQRVGIAQSIVNSPKVLIMDEPTVGLDPKQVIEIRNLVKRLAKMENRTIILSTHILAEASEICEKAIIIDKGHIVAVDSIANLQHHSEQQYLVTATVLRNHDQAEKALKSINGVLELRREDDRFEVISEQDIREQIAKSIVDSGAGLIQLNLKMETLEDIFVKLVK